MRHFSLIFASAGLLLSHGAFAWGDLGHGAVGYIAEKNLTPEGKAFVHSIIGENPMAIAAVWPDHVRSDPRYKEFAPFHFLELKNGVDVNHRRAEDIPEHDANTILTQVPDLLVDSQLDIQQKIILMNYLIHVVGDVHQPVHIGNGTDMGANLCTVKWTSPHSRGGRTTSLHSVWDESLVDVLRSDIEHKAEQAGKSIKYFSPRDLGDSLLSDYQADPGSFGFDRSKIENQNIPTWYKQSVALYSVVYPDQGVKYAADQRPYCKHVDPKTGKVVDGSFNESSVPTLDENYIQTALPVVRKQLLIAGFRLAAMINKMATRSGIQADSAKAQKEFFDKVLLKNPKP